MSPNVTGIALKPIKLRSPTITGSEGDETAALSICGRFMELMSDLFFASVNSGDLGYMDDDGFLYIRDRCMSFPMDSGCASPKLMPSSNVCR
jgi:acyl-CoA synthetase (AMP-forming)/AMP-acid ligase II